MIINGIERGILIFIDDEDGNSIDDFFFHDFQEYNEFVNENFNKYSECDYDVSYSIVEVIDGKPEPFSWTAPIDFLEIADDEIESIIYDFLEWEKEVDELFSKENELTATRTEEFQEGNAEEKLKWKNEYTYACPYCMQDLNHCECRHYPYYLIQIDSNILPTVRILNKKGYKTTSCCGGHLIDKFKKCPCIYISFAEKYDFAIPFPENAIYSSDGSLRYEKGERSTLEELSVFRDDTINALYRWAQELPGR